MHDRELFIDGRWRAAREGRRATIADPATGEPVGSTAIAVGALPAETPYDELSVRMPVAESTVYCETAMVMSPPASLFTT